MRVQDQGGGVGRIEYRVNGVLVGAADLRGHFGLGLPGQHEESRPFTLPPGAHRVEVRAFDASGRVASAPLGWTVQVTGASPERPALVGLAVGIGAYQDQRLSLQYGDRDAEVFAQSLRAGGEGLFARVEVETLVGPEATREGIRAAFAEVAARAGPNDVFVLFLAGHGLVEDGRYLFLPHDLRLSKQAALRAGALDEDDLAGLLATVPANKSLLVLDTCYAGAALDLGRRAGRLLAARGGGGLETLRVLARLMEKTGRTVLASATEQQYALEGLDGHGVFTHVLLRGLRGAADSGGAAADGLIETGELALFLEREVPRASLQRWQYEQYPMHELQGQSFPIARTGAAP